MAYFLTQPYEEEWAGDHTYTFKITCASCGSITPITVKGNDLYDYHHGKYIQDAFPYISKDDRELMISGICGNCFSLMMEDE